ncbi:hypothetical protein NM208_g7481 [Fusarium decemcellulare]|uniref:Uncharacterized protein n=1 Tax=Fusarium decemcellulare TaxID=57161 RepID=A0ACC1S954_9HYPO|nr:hypothetical protein NM208_g7481 [Fusarium decemcellulare]
MESTVVAQPWKQWFEKEKQDASSFSLEASEKPWLRWKPTPEDPSVKPWLAWNSNMDNGDLEGPENKRIRTHVMGACSSFAGPRK